MDGGLELAGNTGADMCRAFVSIDELAVFLLDLQDLALGLVDLADFDVPSDQRAIDGLATIIECRGTRIDQRFCLGDSDVSLRKLGTLDVHGPERLVLLELLDAQQGCELADHFIRTFSFESIVSKLSNSSVAC